MARTASPQSRLADAAFRLLAKEGWNEMTLAAVARTAKMPLKEMQSLAPSKAALIGVMLARAGEETSARYKPDRESEDARDRVLDVALCWFETIATKKAALRALHEGLARDPLALVAMRGEFLRAAEWLLALAEADSGRAISIKTAALAALIARTLPVWLEDDKELSKTMARLDQGLRRLQWLF